MSEARETEYDKVRGYELCLHLRNLSNLKNLNIDGRCLTQDFANFDAELYDPEEKRKEPWTPNPLPAFIMEARNATDPHTDLKYSSIGFWVKWKKVKEWGQREAYRRMQKFPSLRFLYILRFYDHRTFFIELSEQLINCYPTTYDQSNSSRPDGVSVDADGVAESNALYLKIPEREWRDLGVVHVPADRGAKVNEKQDAMSQLRQALRGAQ